MNSKNSIEVIQKKTIRNFAIVFAGLIFVLGFIYFVIFDYGKTTKESRNENIELTDRRIQNIDTGSVLLERTRKRRVQFEKTAEAFEVLKNGDKR